MKAASEQMSKQLSVTIEDGQIKHMVQRFLSWKLPENFNPDGGVSFKKTFNEHTSHPMKHEPCGTNLLNAIQAEAMIRHLLVGLPPASHLTGHTYSQAEYDDAYEIGKRDGYSEAVQQIDQLTGGDGEYRYCLGDEGSSRHTPGPAEMIQRIVDRFEVLNLLDEATRTGSDQPDDAPAPAPQVMGDE